MTTMPRMCPNPAPSPNWGKLITISVLGWVAWLAYKSERHSTRTRHGFDREEASARYLASRGAAVGLSPGSKGPIDLAAEWDDGTRWAIQQKSSRDGRARLPRPSERARLRNASKRIGATPVVALTSRGRTTYRHAATGERLIPPRRR